MIRLVKQVSPVWLKRAARGAVKLVKYRYRRVLIARAVRRGDPVKIIVGAAETWQRGWYSTNEQWLDIADPGAWDRVFGGKRIVSHVVAEHVFEHLTYGESLKALRCMAEHLGEMGRVRIAVPDGYHPDDGYLRHVGINGIGDDASDHKQLLNVDTLSAMLREAGFRPVHIEGYDARGHLVKKTWSAEDGFVRRSRANGARNVWSFVDADTSLIVDGFKK